MCCLWFYRTRNNSFSPEKELGINLEKAPEHFFKTPIICWSHLKAAVDISPEERLLILPEERSYRNGCPNAKSLLLKGEGGPRLDLFFTPPRLFISGETLSYAPHPCATRGVCRSRERKRNRIKEVHIKLFIFLPLNFLAAACVMNVIATFDENTIIWITL